MGRAILSVLAGFATWTVLWLTQNAILGSVFSEHFDEEGFTTATHVLLVVLLLSVVDSVVAGWVTGVVAREKEVARTVALGIVQLVVGIGVQSSVWELMPLWYHLSFLVLLLPGNVVGGLWASKRRESRT